MLIHNSFRILYTFVFQILKEYMDLLLETALMKAEKANGRSSEQTLQR